MSDQDNAVKDEAATQDTAVQESAPVETKETEVADPVLAALSDDDAPAESKPKAKQEPKAETEAQPSQEAEAQPTDEPSDETDAEEQPRGKAEERKSQLNTEIRDLVAKRNALRQEVEQQNSQVYQAQDRDELVEQGMSPEMAAIEQMRQEREIERYNNQVAEAQLTIDHEASRVINDYPIFNPESDHYKPELAQRAATLLQSNLVFDQNTGQVIGSNVSPYLLYQTLAETYQSSATEGQAKAQRSVERMSANADVPSSAAPPKQKIDPVMAVLESDD